MCICTSVFVSLCTFHMPPHLVFANLHSSPPLPPLLLINSSWDPADTQICGGTTASRTLLQHIFQIAQKSRTNFAQILHIYQHSCTKLHNSCKNISQISQYLTQWLHLHSALWRMTSPASKDICATSCGNIVSIFIPCSSIICRTLFKPFDSSSNFLSVI